MVSSLKVWPYILRGSRLCSLSEFIRRLARHLGCVARPELESIVGGDWKDVFTHLAQCMRPSPGSV